jgi:hypothetical protein
LLSQSDASISANHLFARENDIITLASSRKSSKLPSLASQKSYTSCVSSSKKMQNVENKQCRACEESTRCENDEDIENDKAESASKRVGEEAESLHPSLSSTRFLTKDDVNDVASLCSRENEILSAAASRKTGRHSSTSGREVLIEEYEKPREAQGELKSSNSATAWKKIDTVLFGDDESELKLFNTPMKDVAFDDFLTTTSSCSTISASMDPSGYIVNTPNAAPRLIQFPVRSAVQFDRVKSVLNRMRTPLVQRPSPVKGPKQQVLPVIRSNNPLNNVSRPIANKLPPICGLVANRVPIVRATDMMLPNLKTIQQDTETDDVESAKGVPVVTALSFNGERNHDVIETKRPNQVVFQSRIVEQTQSCNLPRNSTNSKDPPANTLCS